MSGMAAVRVGVQRLSLSVVLQLMRLGLARLMCQARGRKRQLWLSRYRSC